MNKRSISKLKCVGENGEAWNGIFDISLDETLCNHGRERERENGMASQLST
jgi:hypothetical protein